MNGFAATNQRLRTVHARMPDFPLEQMRLVRMTYQLQKLLRDKTNAALKPHELADASYMMLAVLYGSAEETLNASQLGEACYEKPANLTRVCDDLQARGMIVRGERAGDRRCVMISLTTHGRDLIETALPDVATKITAAYGGLGDSEMQQFAAMYERVLYNLTCSE
jgi:MarR family transcriptional repressor of emrRAB